MLDIGRTVNRLPPETHLITIAATPILISFPNIEIAAMNYPQISRVIVLAVFTSIAASAAAPASAEIVSWRFPINEQSVKNGPEADGSTNSPGRGQGTIELNLATNVVTLDLAWDGLVGELTKLHIHGPATEDQNNPQHIIEIFGPPDVPADLAATSGIWTDNFELQALQQPNFAPLEVSDIVATMLNGDAYLNVHTSVFGTGEIRGNLGQPVPEPSGIAVTVIGISVLSVWRRRASL